MLIVIDPGSLTGSRDRGFSAMSSQRTIYLDFACTAQDYLVDSADSPGLLTYVLDGNAGLEEWFTSALGRVYPNEPWSSPGNSMFRRLCAWVSAGEDFPEVQGHPDCPAIVERLEHVRGLMMGAWTSRSFEHHYYSDFPVALHRWQEAGYRVIMFNLAGSEQRQRRVLELAIPDGARRPVVLADGASGAILDDLAREVSALPDRCYLVVDAQRYGAVAEWRRRRLKVVLLDRRWVEMPYLERGYGLNIGALTDFDPEHEAAREYY